MPSTRRARRPAHRRPPSDIEFAHSWASSRFGSEGGADAYAPRHGYTRSYDDFGYPLTATYPHPDDAIWESELSLLRHARNTSGASYASAHTVRDSFSMHATAPTSPASPASPTTPAFDRAPSSRRQQQRRRRRPQSIEKPPLDVEEQLAMFASASSARRAGASAGINIGFGADRGMQLVGSPVVSVPSSRPSTATGTGTGTGLGMAAPRPLPPPPVPPVPSHLREPLRSPGQSVFDLWDMAQPPPYRLLDNH